MAASVHGWQCSGQQYCRHHPDVPKASGTKGCRIQRLSSGFSGDKFFLKSSTAEPNLYIQPSLRTGHLLKNRVTRVMFPDIWSPSFTLEFLDAWDDEYGGVIIDPSGLTASANAFASALRASMSNWKLKGKKGIWLKIPLEQSNLVPIAIQEGFDYHHAERGYVMLTYWIPDEPCMLPAGPSHQIGVGGFVINDRMEVLVVKERCPCSCSDVWKMPTGYINKSEDIFSGVIREVKEETGIDTIFQKMVAARHAHFVSFEKSDLLFVCVLKPLSYQIKIDEKEIQDAKWMPLDEFMGQSFYEDDHLSKRVNEACVAAYEDRYNGFVAHQLSSKLDGKLSYLYYDNSSNFEKSDHLI